MADGIEARLIEAEALLQANNFSGMRTMLNDLRDTQGLDPLPSPADREEAIDQRGASTGMRETWRPAAIVLWLHRFGRSTTPTNDVAREESSNPLTL